MTKFRPRVPTPTEQAEPWLRRDPVILALSALAWLALVLHFAVRLPRDLSMTGDSAAYLDQASYRPPFYGWVLDGWRDMTGSLSHLPLVQFLMMAAGLLAFAIEFGRLNRNALAGAIMVPLVMMHPAVYDAPRWMMTETVYLAQILFGLAAQCRFARRDGLASLLAAAVCFGMAALTRSTGYAFLLLPLLTGLFDHRRPLRATIIRPAAAAAAIALVLAGGMGWNLQRHGRFEIGSWSGLSLLQKSLFLVEPSDVAGLPPPIAAVAPVAAAERGLVARQPDLAARLRAHIQVTSSDLRWGVFIPQAEHDWGQWSHADWRERGLLGGAVSHTLIARHPAGYARLWRNDWLALVLQPAYWPGWASATIAGRDRFAACRTQGSCWALERYDLPLPNLLVMMIGALGGTILSLGLIACWTLPLLRRRLSAPAVLFWSMAVVLHAGLLLSSAFEAGHIRMTAAFAVLDAALLVGMATLAARHLLASRNHSVLPRQDHAV